MPHSTPQQTQGKRHSLYDEIGGEQMLKKLVDTFYDIVETRPEGHQLHLLHLRGNGIAHSRIEQLHFLSGFFGGPKLYLEKHGHANVKTMHEHVEINTESKDAWLQCMAIALSEMNLEANLKQTLMTGFTGIAERLVNRPH